MLLDLVEALFRLHDHPAQARELFQCQKHARAFEVAAFDGRRNTAGELFENDYFEVTARAVMRFEVGQFGH